MPDEDDPLEGLSHDELLVFARTALARDPSLARNLPDRRRSSRSRADPEAATRKRVRNVFRHAGFVGWRNEREVLAELEEVAEDARREAQAGRSERALVMLAATASEVVAHFDQVDDSNGVISGEVTSWLEELPVHIDEGLDPSRRLHLVHVLLDIADADYGFDQQGGPALALLVADDPFLTSRIERWVAERRAASRKRWGNEDPAAVHVMLDLLAEQERWDEYLALADEAGEWERFTHVGLQRGRDPVELAERVANRAVPMVQLKVGWLLHAAGHADAADVLFGAVLARVPESEEGHRGAAEVALARGRRSEAERHLMGAIATGRGSAAYGRLREVLEGSPRWERVRRAAHESLRASGDLVTLVTAFLEEDEPIPAGRAALELDPAWAYRTMRAAAKAVEEADPDLAVALYRRLAEGCIEQRKRQQYRIAAGYLAKARDVLTRAGRADEVAPMIAEVREANRRRPAMLAELVARRL